MNFRQFIEHNPLKIQASFSQNTVGKHNDFATSAFMPSTWTGSEDLGTYGYGLPSTDIKLPVDTFRSKVATVMGAGPGDMEGSTQLAKDVVTIIFQNGEKVEVSRSNNQLKRFTNARPLKIGTEYKVTLYRNADRSPGNILSVE